MTSAIRRPPPARWLLLCVAALGACNVPEPNPVGDDVEESSAALTGSAALLIVGNATAPSTDDEFAESRIKELGLTPKRVGQATVAAGDLTGKRVVVVTSSVNNSRVGTLLKKAVVPVVTWRWEMYEWLGLVAKGKWGRALTGQGKVVLKVASTDAMAAGLSGTRRVLTGSTPTSWGLPPSAAKIVATTSSGSPTIFRYSKGNPMSGLSAPERRVAIGFMSESAETTNEGRLLLQAAIGWAAYLPQLTGTACTAGSQCVSGTCSSNLCKGRANLASCTSPLQCKGNVCTDGKCLALLGGSCAKDAECGEALCVSGKCATPLCDGGAVCPAGLVCPQDRVCRRPTGDDCAKDSHCLSLNCRSGKCAPGDVTCLTNDDCIATRSCVEFQCKVNLGEVCGRDDECDSGICGGRCCATQPCSCPMPAPENLLRDHNSKMDQAKGLAEWTVNPPLVAPVRWDVQDADSCVFSGAAQLSPQPEFVPAASIVSACVPLIPGQTYRFGARFMVSDFPLPTWEGSCSLSMFETPTCTGAVIGGSTAPFLGAERAFQWNSADAQITAPPAGLFGQMFCRVSVTARPPLPATVPDTWIDNLYISGPPEPPPEF
jgi:hypothetical protein